MLEEVFHFPLSYAQQRLWFIDQLDPAAPTYNISSALRLSGKLNVAALSGSIDEIIRRHEVLRTTFSSVDGQPVQIISSHRTQTLSLVDLSDLDSKESQAVRLAKADAQRGFDLERGPLLRATLLRLAPTEHIALFTLHHIISDGWSMGILIREFSLLYNSFCHARPSPLKPLALQYADFAVWQREWLTTEKIQRQLQYWRKQLAAPLPVLELPFDRPRSSVRSHGGATRSLRLSVALTESLNALSKQHGVTLFMTLMSAFNLLLYRYTGEEDIIVGTPVTNRNRAEVEDLIGLFVNTLVIRTDLSGDFKFAELLSRVKRVILEAQTNQHLPFEKLVDVLQPDRDLSHTPLFQVMFVHEPARRGALDLHDLKISPVETDPETAKFDLSLVMAEDERHLTATLQYNTDLFNADLIERMLRHLKILLESIVDHLDRCSKELPLLTEEEKRQLLVTWNGARNGRRMNACLHNLFESQVERTPEGVAVAREDVALSYGELNARANRLAHYLRGMGVEPETYVAIRLERSPELVAAQLAVLKCGAAYVPIDPTFPDERQVFMAQDCEARAVITTREARLADGFDAPRVDIDDPRLSERPSGNLGLELESEMAAYVMYTSGSTGKPKGVVVRHKGITRLVINSGYADFRSEDRVAFAANPTFDAATMEVWAPLLNGGRIVIIDQSTMLEPARLAEELTRHAVGVLWMTAGHYHQCAESLGEAIGGLRCLMVGGDKLDARVIARTLRDNPPSHLINGYGPTETTTFAATHEVETVAEGAKSIPLGRPISATRIYILDAHRQPAPIEVGGELYIGGDGVARGYLNRPEQTAERFLPDPFSVERGSRMYKTGDLGRWLPEGVIEFLGRNDFQVKIRGFRVELEEIEAALVTHPEVGAAVVLAREEGGEGKRLVAYYSGEKVGAEALRAHLLSALPKYMIPEAFVHLESLPLTLNGKLDRRALPAPEDRSYVSRGYERPTGEVEIRLARIWTEALKLERVGRHDNFFELGGHSLLAMRLVSDLKQMGIVVPVIDLFMHPTVESLATHIQTLASKSRQKPTAIQLRAGGVDPPLFLAHDVTGEIISGSRLTPHLASNFPVYGLPSPGLLEEPLCAIEAMAARLARMVRGVQPKGPYRIAGWSFGATLAYEIASQLIIEGASVEFLGSFDGYYLGPGIDRPENMQLDDQSLLLDLKERSIVPAGVSIDEVRQYLKRFRNNLLAARTYAANPIPIPLHLFVARDSEASAAANPHRNWGIVMPVERIHLIPVPGTHLSMMESPQIEALGDALSQTLRQVRPTRPLESKKNLGSCGTYLS